MTIVVNTGEVINEDNLYVPPEFRPTSASGEPANYTISREGDTYYVDWHVYTGDDFTWPLNDNIVVAAPYYAQAASPAPGRIPLEIEGDMHFGGEKFMVRAIIENLKEDPNDPTALPADAIGVKATLVRPAGISLISGQNDTFYVGDILIGESRNVSWLVKAISTGIHNICVNVSDIYSHEWEGCAEVKAIEPATVNIKYCVPPSVQAGVSFVLDAEVFNPTELTAKDFSITFTSFNQYIKLAAGESPDRYLGDIAPNESILVSWVVVPAVSGTVEDVFFETFYEQGPVLTYEISGVCGGIPANLSYLHLVPPVIYTTDGSGDYERVFTPYNDVNIVVVVKNPLDSPASGRMIVYVEDNETGGQVGDLISDSVVYLEPYSYSTSKFSWNTKDYGRILRSGFTFIGKRFNVVVKLDRTYRYGFYVDEYGVPKWLRDNVEFHIGDKLRDIIDNANNKGEVIAYYESMMDYANSSGFTSVLFHHYYSYGYHESHQNWPHINYWFPAGVSEDSHYFTPYPNLVRLTGSESEAQNLIKQLVGIAHSRGLRVVAYVDPIAIYDPTLGVYALDYVHELISGYPAAIKHHNSTSLGYVAMNEEGDPVRVSFLEAYMLPSVLSDTMNFAYQVSPCGPAKDGLANDEEAFSPTEILADLNSNWKEDPSHHYQTVKEVHWLIKNYDFDGISTDDTGRLIMNTGHAKYAERDDLWTLGMCPEKPTKSLYGTSEDLYCKELRGGLDKDSFAMDSFANMINHLRDQIKYYDQEKYLISNDYFVPADVDWKSIVSSEDVSASDQFNILKPSFARWAYLTYNEGYKVLRNDLRRSTLVGLSIPATPELRRPDWLRGVLLATSWANNVHSEILFNELSKTPDTERLLKNYVDMRRNVTLPIYNEIAQDLLYHSHLKDSNGFQEDYELQHTGEKTYSILYRIPSEYGEKARILHVINSRVISDILFNNDVPKDYEFRIRIPVGEEVSGVYLVSADMKTGTNETVYTNYTKNITSNNTLWHIRDNYIYITIPNVITSTIAYIEFKPLDKSKNSVLSTSRTNSNGFMESLSQSVLKPLKENENVKQSLIVSPEDSSLSLSLEWPGSDLDLHLYSPSGRHIGFNYTTNSTDLIGNSTYTAQLTSERITVQNPEPGDWTLEIYGKNVSGEEPYSLEIVLEGDYSPNVTIELTPKTAVVNETLSLPLTISNLGEATAYNISVSFSSDHFNISKNITYEKLIGGVSINTDILAVPLGVGNGTIYLDVNYLDAEGNSYSFSNSTIMEIVTNPRLYISQTYSPVYPIENKTVTFNVTIINSGSSDAMNINVTVKTDLTNTTPIEFIISNLSAGETVNITYNVTATKGRYTSVIYAFYENLNGDPFIAGGGELEINVEKALCGKGDLNCDGIINRTDYLKFENIYKNTCNDILYNPLADFDEDCDIDFIDFVRFARVYGE